MNNEFEQLKQELLSLGFDADKFNELLDIATEEAIDITMEKLSQNLSDEELDSITKELEKPLNNKDDATQRINMLFQKAYGDNAENKKLELINSYLRKTLNLTKESKDLLERYQQGDPKAVANVQSHADDPDVKDIQDSIN
jgi:acyl-homoserine lactone acylase PvdQ